MDLLTFRLLAALQREPADGNALLARIGTIGGGGRPSLPTLYRCLRTCLETEWIESSASKDDAGRGRPPRVYRLTSAGERALETEARLHRELAALVLGEAPGAAEG